MSPSCWSNPPSIEGPTYGPLVNSTLRCGHMYMPVQYRVVNAGVMVGLMCTLKGFWASQDGMSC